MRTKREPIKLSSVRAAQRNGSDSFDSNHALLEGLSAPPGEHLFRILSRSLAVALGTRFGFVSEVATEPGCVNLLAFWTGERFGDNFTYQVKGTPCERVLGSDLVSIQKDVQKAYPKDAWLGEIGAQSYMAAPLIASDGSALGHIGVLHDAPVEAPQEQVAVLWAFANRAAGELERQTEHARVIEASEVIAKAPVGILQVDQAGNISSTNEKLAAMFGYEEEELLGRPVEKLVPGSMRRRHREHRTHFMRDPHDRPMGANLNIVGRRKDGSTFPVTISLSGAGGRATAFVADATTVRQAADLMARNQARLEAVVQAFPEMTFIIDGEGVYHDYETADGVDPYVPPEAFLGKSIKDVMPEELAGQVLERIKLALRTGRVQRLAYELDTSDGKHSYEARIVRLDRDRVAAFVRDYTAEEWLIDDKAEQNATSEPSDKAAPNNEWRNPYRLSYREFSVLHLLKGGTTDKEIANDLGISVFTVNKHVSNILMKMDAASRTEATIRALQEGLID